MDKLIEKAMRALKAHPEMNEIQLEKDGKKVRVVRSAPVIDCWPSCPINYTYQWPPKY